MPSEKLIKIIKLLFYSLALTPLIITPMTIFPFNFGRGLITQFLIDIIFFLYLALAVSDKNYRPKKSAFLVLLASFFGVFFISSFFGVHFLRSFWSAEERFTGLFYLLHMFLLFIAMGAVFRDRNDWKIFFKTSVAVSIVMFGIAILSLFGVKFWGVDLGTRISGTLGNPIFLAVYFILNLTFAAYLLCTEKIKKCRFLWFLACAILAAGIILAQTRGAFLGLICGIVFGIVYYALHKNKKVKIILFGAAAALVAAVGILVILKDNKFINDNALLNRISDISLNATTSNTRFIGWKIALLAIKDRPLLGWGVENYSIAFNKYYDPQLLRFSYYETWFDKPHNKILEIAVDGGVIGAGLYLSIFFYAFYLIYKKTKKGDLPLGAASTLIGGLGAYFAQNLFVFDTPVSYFLFFSLLAFINFNEKEGAVSSKKISAAWLSAIAVLGFLLAWFLNIIPFKASVQLRSSMALMENSQKVDLIKYKKGMAYFNPYKEGWRDDLAKNMSISLRTKNGFYEPDEAMYALSELQESIKDNPNSAYLNMLLGIFYAELGPADKKYFELAQKQFKKALELSPKRQHIYFAMARMFSLMGDEAKLIEAAKTAINLEPAAALAYWEGGKQLYFTNENNPLIKEWISKAANIGYAPKNNEEFFFLFNMSYAYFLENKNYAILSVFYERMGQIEPQEAKWHAQRATAEYMIGYKEAAIAEIKKAIELDDSYRAEGEKFIKMIENTK